MLERFTEHARRALALAGEKARSQNNNCIETLHLFSGLCHENGGLARRALEVIGIVPDVLGMKSQEFNNGQPVHGQSIFFTADVKAVLELAFREMNSRSHSHIGTGHILMGLLRQDEGVLLGLGVDVHQLRRQVSDMLLLSESETDFRPPLDLARCDWRGSKVVEIDVPPASNIDHLRELLDSSWLASRTGVLPAPVSDDVADAEIRQEVLRNQQRWTKEDAVPEHARSFGVALSGGGSRAAAFSLGVLHYLVVSGMSRFVVSISSVSGGSLANAAALGAGDYSSVELNEWRSHLRASARALARGVVPIWALLAAVIGYLAMAAAIAICAHMAGGTWPILLALIASILLLGLGTRGRLLEVCINRRCLSDTAKERWRAADGGCLHIFSATDLERGTQVHFRGAGGGKSVGTQVDSPSVRLSRAIRASAAFPGLLPPAPVRLSNGVRRLVDGGVVNNLATDWYERAPLDPRTGELDPRLDRANNPDALIVVDAGAPLKNWPHRWLPPMVGDAAILLRAMSVLYENTVAPRRDVLSDRLVIHEFAPHSVRDKAIRGRYTGAAVLISLVAAPGQLAASLWWEVAARTGKSSISRRARVAQLWDRIFDVTGLEPNRFIATTFLPLRSSVTVSLMRQGFLSAMEAMYVGYDAPLLETPSQDEFYELIGMRQRVPRSVRREAKARKRAEDRTFAQLYERERRCRRDPPMPDDHAVVDRPFGSP